MEQLSWYHYMRLRNGNVGSTSLEDMDGGKLKDNILILAFLQHIPSTTRTTSNTFVLVHLPTIRGMVRISLGPGLFRLFCVPLLLSLDLLESEEFLSKSLVELNDGGRGHTDQLRLIRR